MAEIKTRQRIIEAVLPLFREKGFDAVTIQDICSAADINKHTFYYHFKSKDELLEEYYNFQSEITPEIFARIMSAKNYVEQVWIVFERLIEFATTSGPDIVRQLSIKDISEKFGAFKKDKIKILYNSIAPMIQKGKDSGEFRTNMENELVFILFLQTFHGTSNWNIREKEFDFEKMMRIIYESLFDVAPEFRITTNVEYNEAWSIIREAF
ncbi:TetR/AcrR family transcriptional regulator [Clostridium pasteurianum]|uniref:Transcriptional regulator n=1 Tax=Clostridium pasteurianum BC1 TaxID=86416 RepID=R4KG08_CLOPA|nr:TetR/AcrR family transcriptional regulator [Clostridium pasteurianum]AGK98530.1 transcriptional regulator [Clostridium pasteurianum BC1]